MEIFDALPRPIKRVLAAAPYNYDVQDIARAWRNFETQGWSPERAARQLQRDFNEFAWQQQRETHQ